MHPWALLLILVAAGAAPGHAHPAGAGTPTARFWEQALPGTPMPEAIADLVQEGIDHSPPLEHYFVPDNLAPKYTVLYHCHNGCPDKAAVPPGLFFHKAQVHVGSTMTVCFAPEAMPAILPRDVAKKVPFSNLADVLSMFNITPSSTEAAKVSDTLRRCQASSDLGGEQKACSTSLEGTVQSAMRMLGTSRAWAVASALSNAGLPLQTYVIQAVRPLDGERHVGCHNMPYPYSVYQCHMTGLPTKSYVISLRGLRKGLTCDMAAICHLDTSSWNPAYPAFEILHTQPGGVPVCHFVQYANLVFGEKAGHA